MNKSDRAALIGICCDYVSQSEYLPPFLVPKISFFIFFLGVSFVLDCQLKLHMIRRHIIMKELVAMIVGYY
jgi:hypothetical protein